ncbi:flavin reductase family protein [Arthrobacter mobilis]|uniref:Flavin reductase family protein n=1 Tax=Arthrobacter mobilis TaxID=2724944 RepID=A0A7X6K6E1_9MICC|nr:flavin reductase family protein [Arthrobacter mobilis]NKX55629.1 flavin reductase family protein [Arthrobacter mobilis]
MAGNAEAARIDAMRFREVMGHYPTGVTAITGIGEDGEALAMVVGTFTSVSLDPPLVAFLPTRTSFIFDKLRTARSLAVNILAHDQEALCRRLARPVPDKLKDESWQLSAGGAPVLDGVVASIDCTLDSVLDGGDHHIALCTVQDLRVHRAAAPLVFFQGGYGGFAPRSFMVPADKELASAVSRAQVLRAGIEQLAAELGGDVTLYTRVENDAVSVVSAAGPQHDFVAPLGVRYPLIPPLGDAFVAWSTEEDQEAWIGRAYGASDEDRAMYRRRLAEARERGWSLSLDAPGRRESLEDAVVEYGQGTPLPARQRELSQRIVASSRYYNIDKLDPETKYDVAAITAPILDAGGHTQLVLRLYYPPAQATGAQVQAWGERMRAFGEQAAQLLAT